MQRLLRVAVINARAQGLSQVTQATYARLAQLPMQGTPVTNGRAISYQNAHQVINAKRSRLTSSSNMQLQMQLAEDAVINARNTI